MADPNVSAAENEHNIAAKKTGLLDLPPELWSRICKLAVEREGALRAFAVIRKRHNPKTPEEAARALNCRESEFVVRQPALLFTCRAIREECLPHYYASNTFYTVGSKMSPEYIERWLNSIGEPGRNAVGGIYQVAAGPNWLVEVKSAESLRGWEFKYRRCSDEEKQGFRMLKRK